MTELDVKLWQLLAGEGAKEMMNSRDAALMGLRHANADHRRAAVAIMQDVWGIDAEVSEVLEQLLISDTDLSVRSGSLFALAIGLRGTCDPRLGDLFARIAQDERISFSLRESAYGALGILYSIPVCERPHGKISADQFSSEYVSSFLRDTFKTTSAEQIERLITSIQREKDELRLLARRDPEKFCAWLEKRHQLLEITQESATQALDSYIEVRAKFDRLQKDPHQTNE